MNVARLAGFPLALVIAGLLARVADGQNRLLVNEGAGNLVNGPFNLPDVYVETHAVVLGDVDGDGDVDILVGAGYSQGEQNRLYLNDGTGVFADATANLPAVLDVTEAVALGDVDGDGDLDALIGNVPHAFGFGGQNSLYLNDGTGVFVDATVNLPAVLDATEAVALGALVGVTRYWQALIGSPLLASSLEPRGHDLDGLVGSPLPYLTGTRRIVLSFSGAVRRGSDR